MVAFVEKIVSILAQIRTPLTVAGLSVLIIYRIYHQILKLRIFESVGRKGTLSIIHAILRRLFWLAILAVCLGVISYIVSLYFDRRTPQLRSSTRLVDAHLDNMLATPLITSILRTKTGVDSRFAIAVESKDIRYPESVAAVDFKLQNTGQGTALIWKAGVEVVGATINIMPVLRFTYTSVGSALDFHAVNTGWGAARCDLAIHNSQLEDLFPQSLLSFKGDLYTGDRILLRLSHSGVNPKQFDKIRKLIADRERAISSLRQAIDQRDIVELTKAKAPLFSESEIDTAHRIVEDIKKDKRVEKLDKEYFTKSYLPGKAIPADDVTVTGMCSDANQHSFSINEKVEPTGDSWFGNYGGRLWIGISTFEIDFYGPGQYVMLASEPTVVVVIDPESAPQEKTYPLSRAIPPGGVERFFITLGATKSAKVSVRFKIYVDQEQLKSDLFSLDLWCPSDCRFSEEVPDGTEFINENGSWIFPHPRLRLRDLELKERHD